MKILLLPFLTLLTSVSLAQVSPKFELTKDGVQPIIIQLDSLNANSIYKKALNWIQETYKNPSEVLKTNIENETIRIDGFKNNAWFYKSLGSKNEYDMEYSFRIDIKDYKIKLTFDVGQFWADGKKVLYNYTTFFKSNGEIKGSYKDAKPSLEITMNELSNSLVEYIKGTAKKNDW